MPARSVILSALTVCCLAGPALAADPPCTTRESMIAALSADYGEQVRFQGASPAAMLKLLASDKGSWSLIVTLPDGRSCLVASGDRSLFRQPGRAL